MSKRYFVGKLPDLTKLITYQPINSILDWYVFSLDSEDLNGINSLSDRFVEMDTEMAVFGMRSLGDIRSTIKVPADELKSEADFDNLTYAPIDKSLIVKELLSKKEILWLNRYHKKVYQTLKKYMDKKELDFLKKSCSNI